MSKKHYVKIAEAFRKNRPTNTASAEYKTWAVLREVLTSVFESENQIFDREKFLAATER